MIRKIFLCGSLMFLIVSAVQAQSRNNQNIRYVENLTAQLTNVVRSVQDENARLEMKVSELQRQVSVLLAKNKEMEQELLRLKRQSAAEAEAREAQLREISKQIKRLAALPPPSVPSKKTDHGTSGKYEIFEVPKGATLSAIAKAYNVSVQSIKKANNMRNNNLRVGQKLKIPVR